MADAGWAGPRRRHASATRLLAAVLLHVLLLAALRLGVDRVALPEHARERVSTLVDVTLHVAAPPAAPPRPSRTRGRTPAAASVRPRPAEPAIAAPQPPAEPLAITAPPPASAPLPDRSFLDNAATRQAIRDVARGTLQTRARDLTHEDPGSALVAANGADLGEKRHVTPTPAQALEQGVAAAHKHDCLKGDYAGAGMGLLSAPFLLANEALGMCAHKL